MYSLLSDRPIPKKCSRECRASWPRRAFEIFRRVDDFDELRRLYVRLSSTWRECEKRKTANELRAIDDGTSRIRLTDCSLDRRVRNTMRHAIERATVAGGRLRYRGIEISTKDPRLTTPRSHLLLHDQIIVFPSAGEWHPWGGGAKLRAWNKIENRFVGGVVDDASPSVFRANDIIRESQMN